MDTSGRSEPRVASKRRDFIKAAGVGGAGTLLAGCLGGDGGGSDGDGPLRVGVLAHKPSEHPAGAGQRDGAQYAVDGLNDDGGVLDRDVELITKNTSGDPSKAKEEYNELIVTDEVDVTTGVYVSEVMLNLMDSVAQQKTIHLTNTAATPRISQMVHEDYDKYKYEFRTAVNGHHWGVDLVSFVEGMSKTHGWNDVAVLVEDFAWTQPISDVLDERLGDVNVNVVKNTRYAGDTEDFQPLYDDVESTGADAALIAMAHTGAAALIQYHDQERDFEMGGVHGLLEIPSTNAALNNAGQFVVAQTSGAPGASMTDTTQGFIEGYHDEYDVYPQGSFAYNSYDSVNLWAAAVEEAGTADSDELIPVLEDISYTGVRGPLEFYGKDHEFAHDLKYGEDNPDLKRVYLQFQDDVERPETVWPQAYASTEYQQPSWL